ncbi:hypothetical protein RB653_007233 [Dictyostelium firmibasis]|uniref:EGF-like domain-containing protein n=1 Tax=Dictyostelium firmibasis TaxID=79012 RepID=A0AAN7YXB7_9MYCE
MILFLPFFYKIRNNLLYLFSILYIVVICLWGVSNVVVVESAAINTNGGSTSDSYCPYQALPDTLNDLNFLGFNGEFHIHETFYYNFKNFQKSMAFTLSQKSAFRIYTAPHVVDIDLWLYNKSDSTKAIAHTSDMGGDENLYAELEAGDYFIKFLFFGQNKASQLDCTAITLEIAVSPTSLVQSRMQDFGCPSKQILPVISWTTLQNTGKLTYDSDVNQDGTVLNINDVGSNDLYKFAGSIPFTLPELDTINKFSVDVSMGFDFLTGGSLNILIQSADLPQPTNLLCLKDGNCTMGVHLSKGHSIIKTVLLPGSYVIWIYDQTQEKDSAIQLKCLPFSMFIDIQPAQQVEDFLNCQSYFLPASFNEPGYLDDGGYMYFDEDVYLDLSVKSVAITFNLTQSSYFRTYIPDFRVDIDVSLTQIGKATPIARSYKFGGEEEINAQLGAGSFVLTLFYFGKNADIFCDEYALEVAIIPQTDYIGITCDDVNANPSADFANINSTLFNSDSNSFNLNNNKTSPRYQYAFNKTVYDVQTFATATFTIPQGTDGNDDGIYFFESIIESSFVMGDIRLVLTDLAMSEDQSSIVYVGSHDRNRHVISQRLYPGDYRIQLQTPKVSPSQIDYLPDCLSYTLSMIIKPSGGNEFDPSCFGLANILPSDLNSPAFLGTSNRLHVSGEYLIPALPILTSTSTYHNFTVTTSSLLRVYTQYNKVDIDLNLYEGSKLVAWNTRFYTEEAMVYQLKKGVAYQLRIKYFRLSITAPAPCSTFTLEMVVSPTQENPKDSCDQLNQIPLNLIPTPTTTPFFSSGAYNFNQNSSAMTFKLPFVVPQKSGVAIFRAVLSFDFIWNNLAIVLKSSSSSNIISDGVLGYNRHEIEILDLVPGSYELDIYEPFPTQANQLNLKNCVDFVLEVGIQIKDESDVDKDTVVCPVLMFPSTLNSIGYLSALTGNSLYFQETVLADVLTGKDVVTFSTKDSTESSLVRIYVPAHSKLDINVILSYTSTGITIVASRAIGEDIIYVHLDADDYTITFYYYGLGGPIPRLEDCPSFDAFISIVPDSQLTQNKLITTNCPASSPIPSQFGTNQPFTGQFYRSMSITTPVQTIPFVVGNFTHFYANLDYNDLVASMAMKLQGNYTKLGENIRLSYSPLYQGGEAFINEVIPPGSYILTIYDAFKGPSPFNSIKCAPYSFSYYLNSSAAVTPTCEAIPLPTDISKGGEALGGPQSKTGEVRLSTRRALIPKDKTPTRINFINPTTVSYIRIMTTSDPGNDLDFFIYQNSTSTFPLYSSIQAVTTDNNVWKLDPQSTPYVLELKYFKVNSKVNCNYFTLDLAISNLPSIQAELLCPVIPPNENQQVPPGGVTFPYGKDVQIGSDSYYFSSSRVELNTKNGIFSYGISLTVMGPILFYSNLGFDFLANDFNMILSNVSSSGALTPLARGIDTIPINDDSEVDIYNTINYQLDSGKYLLQITEDVDYNSFGLNISCHSFTFSMRGSSQVVGLGPRITGVSPKSANNLLVNKDYTITVIFSEAFALPAGSVGTPLLDYIVDKRAIFLQSTAKNAAVISASAAVSVKDLSIMLTFSKDLIVPGVTYVLRVDATHFVNTQNIIFSNENTTLDHSYSFLGCDCNGHGTCGDDGQTCVCNDPWAGVDCSKCKAGYHGAASQCVPNTYCDGDNTCNGHGKCSDANGYPECKCNTGYDSSNNALCGSCAYGYAGYPKCVYNPDTEPTFCMAPIIPTTLNSFEYLGFQSKVHIQDNFYLDIVSGSHDLFFTLDETSMLRVFTEPHQLDVDLWLYNATADGDIIQTIDRSITFNHEEVILDVLDAGNYLLSFKYYDWGKLKTNCPTFNMELAIDTLAHLKENTDLLNLCGSPAKLPDSVAIPAKVTKDFSFDDPSINYIVPVSNNKNLVYLWNYTFEIAPSVEGKVALADIEISYQFLPGDLSLVIQSGNGNGGLTCKGSTDSTISGCVYGDNELNRNVIHATLLPGIYTIWIYAPEFNDATSMNCAPFNFKSKFVFINDDEDYFNCEGEILPSSLNNPQFLTNNYLHVQDLYLVDSKHSNISFSVSVNSLIRVNAQQNNAIVMITLIDTKTNQVFDKDSSVIFLKIATGNYIITIESNHIASAKNFCPLLNIEIAIEDANTPLLIPPNCPETDVNSIPRFNFNSLPFIFENGTLHKKIFTVGSKSEQILASYPFTVTQTVQFYSAIASEFLRGDLRINLYKVLDDKRNSQMLFIQGSHDYNYNWIQETLEAGSYVAKIERPQFNLGSGLPKCIPFEFEFSVYPLSALPKCPGESIPLSWNTIRFLGSEGKMHYQSDNFVVPQGKYTHVEIPIQVTNDSIIRIYVNPHIVDIDIRLKDPFTNQTLISGSNLINTEESFVYRLSASSVVYLQLQFWKWSNNIPQCNVFGLEIAVAPVDGFKPVQCENSASYWPTVPSSFIGSLYNYSNLDSNTQYYFQQTSTGLQSKEYNFATKSVTNIHVQVGYDFLTGDLALKLISTSTKNKKVYYGTIAPNRNILEVTNLPVGNYQLVIYEPFSSLKSIMGCSFFNFEIYLEPSTNYDQEDGFYHYLPTTLDSYAYLNYDQSTHIQGEYMMYDGVPAHNSVPFTITTASLIRVQASILPDDENNIHNTTLTPLIKIDGASPQIGSLAQILQPGQHTLNILPSAHPSPNSPVDLEIAIATVEQVSKAIGAISAPTNCPNSDSIQINPSAADGSFYYSETLYASYAKTSQQGIVNQSPFTLTQPTLIYVQIGYQFLLGDFDMYITSDDKNSLHLLGKSNRNTNEINVVLPVGKYYLTIVNPSIIPAQFGEHCTPYRLSITLRSASSTGHSDCSIFNSIPWDLNSPNGGSAQFGGPMDGEGNLRFYSDDFIAPSVSSTQNVSFTVSEPTFVNIFTIDDLTSSIDADIFVRGTDNDQDLLYDVSIHNTAQHSLLFVADPPKSGKDTNFTMSLTFKGVSKDACPAFGLQVIMKPVSYLTNQLYCTKNFSPKLPTTNPKPDQYGTFNEYISSSISGDYINSLASSGNQFEYNIDFSLDRISRIDVSFSFDSIATNFYLKLSTRTTDKTGKVVRNTISTGDWTAENSFGETSMTSIISSSRLAIGNYSITIIQPKYQANSWVTSSIYGELCFPFTYSLTIMDRNQVYAGSVSPTNGFNLLPNHDLSLVIQSHATFYDNTNKTILCQSTQYIKDTFYLASQSSSDIIAPSNVICGSDDGTKWTLVFSNTSLASDSSYILSVHNGKLFDINGIPAVLPPQHIYSMLDTSCSNNGQFKDSVCKCALGYTGVDCNNCAPKYHNINGQGSPICVSSSCSPIYCGCDPNNNSTCTQLGKCKVNPENHAVCICSKPYNGTTCNTCAFGYRNWPYCTVWKDCGDCGKGSCDRDNGQCLCPDNYQGPSCSQCADGYSGSDCKKNGSGAIIALEVIGSLIVASILIGGAVWYIRNRYRSGVARYKMLPKFEFDNDSEHTTQFPGLYDDNDDAFGDNPANKNDKSINKSGGKTHVFSFSSMPSSAVDSDDDDEYEQQKIKAENHKNNHLFDM